MRAWLRHHCVSLALTAARLARSPVATVCNVAVIGFALALPLGGYLLLSDVQDLVAGSSLRPQISVYMSADADKAALATTGERLRRTPGVSAVRFVGRDAALAALRRDPAIADVTQNLDSNPLPDAFVVEVAADAGAGSADRLRSGFQALPGVAEVQLDSSWAQRLDAFLRVGRRAVLLLAGLLSCALIAATFNTIRLQIVTHREEIEVCRLVGATDAYVRRPFFYLGSALGALGGVAGCAIVLLGLFLLNRDIAALAHLYGSQFRLAGPGRDECLAAVLLCALLGWLGAYLSVSIHLRGIDRER